LFSFQFYILFLLTAFKAYYDLMWRLCCYCNKRFTNFSWWWRWIAVYSTT